MKLQGLVLALLLGCGARQPAPPSDVLLPTLSAEVSRPFVLEQRLRGRYGERELDAQVVLQWHEGVLRLIGLAPFGARAFVVEQRGTEVHVESSLGRELPFDPKHVLVDIHRVLFRGAASGLTDGEHERDDGGEHIRERWAGGHVVERRFTQAAQKPVVVSFSAAPAPVLAPSVRLVNEQLGYTLEILTLSQQWL
jgi:hypothetical protein